MANWQKLNEELQEKVENMTAFDWLVWKLTAKNSRKRRALSQQFIANIRAEQIAIEESKQSNQNAKNPIENFSESPQPFTFQSTALDCLPLSTNEEDEPIAA